MTIGSVLVVLAFAPAPQDAEASPLERNYTGAEAVTAPADPQMPPRDPAPRPSGSDGVEVVQPSREIGPADVDGTQLEVLLDDDGPEPPAPRARPVPRILTTMAGPYPGEQAIHWNAARTFSFVPGLQVRTRIGTVSEFRIDEDDNLYDEGAFVGGRVRWRPVFGLGRRQAVRIIGMVDLANGRWTPRGSGDPVISEILEDGQPPQPWDMRVADVRELYLEWTTKYGQLRAGQMSFTWGLGLLANDGNNMDRFGDLKFGNDADGSIQERIVFGTRPLALTGGPGKDVVMAVGADLIYRDPNADLLEGDLAGQGFVVVRYEPEARPGNWIGAYGVYRHQKSGDDGDLYPDDDLLEVGVVDLAGQGFKVLREKLALVGAFETVAIAGRTTFASGEYEELQVLQGAAALHGYIGNPRTWLAGFDAGWTSGDAHPEDQEINDFRAAPGFNAGLLLFDYVLGWQTARSEIRSRDPNLSGVPPNGTQHIPTEGSVTNAIYLQPKARWGLREIFEVWGGPLLAASAVPVIDPVSTRLNGGVPTNGLGGQSDHRYLGTELDLGIRGRYGLKNVWLQGGIQAGVLFPGAAFDDARGDDDGAIWGTWFRAELRY